MSSSHAGEALPPTHGVGKILPVQFLKGGLVIEGIDLRRGTGLKEVDHAFGPGGEVHGSRTARFVTRAVVLRPGSRVQLGKIEKRRERSGSDSRGGAALEEVAAGEIEAKLGAGVVGHALILW